MKITYYDYASTEPQDPASTFKQLIIQLMLENIPFHTYAIAQIRPVNLQAEVNYAIGKYKAYDSVHQYRCFYIKSVCFS